MLRLCHFAYLCPSIERMRKDYSLKVNNEVNSKKQNVRKNLLPSLSDAHPLSCQGSNLDFLESKSSVLPVTPQDNFRDGKSNKKAQSSKKVPSIKNKVLSR